MAHASTRLPPVLCCLLAAALTHRRHACYALEEFESAQDAFEAASQLEPSKTIHKTWVNMCKVQMGGAVFTSEHCSWEVAARIVLAAGQPAAA